METRGNHVRPAWGNGKKSFCKGDSDSTRRGEAHRVSVRIRAAGRSADLSGKRPEGRQGDAFPPSGGEKEGKSSDGKRASGLWHPGASEVPMRRFTGECRVPR